MNTPHTNKCTISAKPEAIAHGRSNMGNRTASEARFGYRLMANHLTWMLKYCAKAMQTRIAITAVMSFFCVPIIVCAAEDGACVSADGKPASMSWDIGPAKVLKSGQLSTNRAGVSLNDYTVEAVAKPVAGGQAPEGKFYLILNAFRPARGAKSENEGKWFGRGTWTLVAQRDAVKNAFGEGAGPHPGVLQGHLLAELAASPADNPENVSAEVWAPVQTAREGHGRYCGDFRGNGRFEGRFSLMSQDAPSRAEAPACCSTNLVGGTCCPTTLSPELNNKVVTNIANRKE